MSVKNLSRIVWPTADHRARQRDAPVQTLNHRSSILTVDSSTVPFSYFYPEFIEIWEVFESCVGLTATGGYSEWNLITAVINSLVHREKKVKKLMMWNMFYIVYVWPSTVRLLHPVKEYVMAWKVLMGTYNGNRISAFKVEFDVLCRHNLTFSLKISSKSCKWSNIVQK